MAGAPKADKGGHTHAIHRSNRSITEQTYPCLLNVTDSLFRKWKGGRSNPSLRNAGPIRDMGVVVASLCWYLLYLYWWNSILWKVAPAVLPIRTKKYLLLRSSNNKKRTMKGAQKNKTNDERSSIESEQYNKESGSMCFIIIIIIFPPGDRRGTRSTL